jgi:hypothetical protein
MKSIVLFIMLISFCKKSDSEAAASSMSPNSSELDQVKWNLVVFQKKLLKSLQLTPLRKNKKINN